jgi:hypothetical protein
MFDRQQVQAAVNRLIHDVVNGLGAMIEGRDWRHHDRTHFGDLRHQSQVAQMKRRLADDEDEPLPFLERDASSANGQIVVIRMRDAGERFH